MPPDPYATLSGLAPPSEHLGLLKMRKIRSSSDDFEYMPSGRYPLTKRFVDVVLASIIFVLSAPVIAVFAGAIRITSHGPAFYSQTRLGRFGRPFRIHKLRTMQHNCEQTSGARWAMRNDPRVTPIGKILRITHLDELPQLWNVLKGEMSLVGPRPERPEFIQVLQSAIPNYRKRMVVRPGVTGLAQIYLPPDTDIPSVRHKLQYDLHYLVRMGLFIDLRLMAATPLKALGLPRGLIRRALFLPNQASLEKLAIPTFAASFISPVLPLAEPRGDPAFESQPEPTA
jgi:lipopolysaccharide/colanic/teichoic acid biosynthesis glycosyltransferase